METLIELVFFFAIALAVWNILTLVYNLYRAYQAIKIIDQKIIDAVERKIEDTIKVIEVNIEKHQDTFYLFSRENNQFIAQGKNKEENPLLTLKLQLEMIFL